MTAQADEVRNPVVTTVLDLRSTLSDLSQSPVWSLDTANTEAALVEAQALITQAEQLHQTRMTRAAAHRGKRLATSLDESHPAVDEALATAAINTEQAQVILDAVADLPDTRP